MSFSQLYYINCFSFNDNILKFLKIIDVICESPVYSFYIKIYNNQCHVEFEGFKLNYITKNYNTKKSELFIIKNYKRPRFFLPLEFRVTPTASPRQHRFRNTVPLVVYY